MVVGSGDEISRSQNLAGGVIPCGGDRQISPASNLKGPSRRPVQVYLLRDDEKKPMQTEKVNTNRVIVNRMH